MDPCRRLWWLNIWDSLHPKPRCLANEFIKNPNIGHPTTSRSEGSLDSVFLPASGREEGDSQIWKARFFQKPKGYQIIIIPCRSNACLFRTLFAHLLKILCCSHQAFKLTIKSSLVCQRLHTPYFHPVAIQWIEVLQSHPPKFPVLYEQVDNASPRHRWQLL